jgi:nucleotide-binding universal stress UspA family protein
MAAMGLVLCAVDSSDAAVAPALARCRDRRAELRFVGVVRSSRDFPFLQARLVASLRRAHAAGVPASAVTRAGDAAVELVREADATGAEEVFLLGPRRLVTRRRALRYLRLRGLAPAPTAAPLRLAA